MNVKLLCTLLCGGLFLVSEIAGAPPVKKKKIIPDTSTAVSVMCSKKDGYAKVGESVTFTGRMTKQALPVKGRYIQYKVWKNGVVADSRIIPSDKPYSVTAKMDVPGLLMFEANAMDEKKKLLPRKHIFHNRNMNAGFGVLAGVEKIKPAVPAPGDFDAFWKKAADEVKKVKMDVVRTAVSIPKNLKGKMKCFDVKIACAGAMPVSGYLLIPEKAAAKSLPVIVSFHGAGVRSAVKLARYGTGAIYFDINAHGIPNGKNAQFYRIYHGKNLPAYQFRNRDNAEKYYFRGMYQRVMRALEYVKSLPQWDGKNLIAVGASQGGAQAVAAAALDKEVTLCVANVPALSDHNAAKVSRVPGWPKVVPVKGKKSFMEATAQASRYYDCNAFAKNINCEIFLSTGGVDLTCFPTSVITVYNALPASTVKNLEFHPMMGHNAVSGKGAARIREIVAGRK